MLSERGCINRHRHWIFRVVFINYDWKVVHGIFDKKLFLIFLMICSKIPFKNLEQSLVVKKSLTKPNIGLMSETVGKIRADGHCFQ